MDRQSENKLSITDSLTRRIQSEAIVMMVDDDALLIEVIGAFLEEAGYERFVHTTRPLDAIDTMLREQPQVVLLDINMPDMNGFEILERMRADPVLQHLSAIVLTAADDPATKLRALELGASDFLRKPVDPSELVLRLRNTLAAKAYQDVLEYYDRGTGLANRQRCLSELERILRTTDAPHGMGALLHFGLDRFKQINDALGPAAGDEIIRETAQRLRDALTDQFSTGTRRADEPFAARFGGDEFSVLLPIVPNAEFASHVADEMLQALARPYQVAGESLHVTAAVGVALFPSDGDQPDELVRNAAAALREAKSVGRNTCRFYAKELNAKAAQRLRIEEELRAALQNEELRLFYQPKVDIASNEVCGAEALMRWQHPVRGLIAPNEFIPVAEESGLIVPMGQWAIDTAGRQMKEWTEAGLRGVPIAVNVSPRQFGPELVEFVQGAIADTGQGSLLHLELTESSVMDNPKVAIALLGELRDLGLWLSIDDFGIGYSSLSYLHLLPLRELKIDRSFVALIGPGEKNVVLVDLIISMAHSLGLTVVAEGVEEQHQLDYLRARGCDEYQGFFFSKPIPALEFSAKYLQRA